MGYTSSSYPPLCPVASVEASIADGLGDVVGLDVRGVVEVGDGAGDFQDAAIGTGGELQAIHRHAEQVDGGGVGFGKLVELALVHLGVAVGSAHHPTLPHGKGAEALGLNLAGTDDTLTDFRTGLSRLQLAQVADGDVGNLYLYVYAVEKRP